MSLLARMDARIAAANSLQADEFWIAELPALQEDRDKIAELIEAADYCLYGPASIGMQERTGRLARALVAVQL